MKTFLFGVGLGFCLSVGALYWYLTDGGMPVQTKGGPVPFEKMISKKALLHAIGSEAARPSPVPADEPNLLAGAKVYTEQCAVCHGRLGRPISAIAAGMFPNPPQLLPPKKGVTDDPVGETYWKAKNGIRLTGMPGYEGPLTDTELWQVSQLLLHANELPSSVLDQLRR